MSLPERGIRAALRPVSYSSCLFFSVSGVAPRWTRQQSADALTDRHTIVFVAFETVMS